MTTFAVVSVLFLLGNAAYAYRHAYHHWVGCAAIWSSFTAIYNLKGKLFYLLHVIGISVYLSFANKPGKPTGVWARWKHINDRNKAWIDRFPTLEEFKAFVDSK